MSQRGSALTVLHHQKPRSRRYRVTFQTVSEQLFSGNRRRSRQSKDGDATPQENGGGKGVRFR
jgi:hypothetical protein